MQSELVRASVVSAKNDNARLTREERHVTLDGLRGFAIVSVLLYHFGGALTPTQSWEFFFRHLLAMGWSGVDLFFVLSGFLITGILYDTRGSEHYFRTFYVRRILRIFPLYYGYLFAFFFLLLPRFVTANELAYVYHNQWWYWFFSSNVLVTLSHTMAAAPFYTNAFWSLAVEEQFYLVWPFYIWSDRRNLADRCLKVAITAIAIRLVLVAAGFGLGAAYLMPARVDALALGAWLGIVRRESGLETFGTLTRLMRWWAGLVILCAWTWSPNFVDMEQSAVQIVGFSVLAVFFTGVVASALEEPDGVWGRLGQNPILRWFGKYSFGMYIYHNAVRFLLAQAGWHPDTLVSRGVAPALAITVFSGVGIATSVALAVISWHVFESPILSLKRFTPYERSASKGAVAAAVGLGRDHGLSTPNFRS